MAYYDPGAEYARARERQLEHVAARRAGRPSEYQVLDSAEALHAASGALRYDFVRNTVREFAEWPLLLTLPTYVDPTSPMEMIHEFKYLDGQGHLTLFSRIDNSARWAIVDCGATVNNGAAYFFFVLHSAQVGTVLRVAVYDNLQLLERPRWCDDWPIRGRDRCEIGPLGQDVYIRVGAQHAFYHLRVNNNLRLDLITDMALAWKPRYIENAGFTVATGPFGLFPGDNTPVQLVYERERFKIARVRTPGDVCYEVGMYVRDAVLGNCLLCVRRRSADAQLSNEPYLLHDLRLNELLRAQQMRTTIYNFEVFVRAGYVAIVIRMSARAAVVRTTLKVLDEQIVRPIENASRINLHNRKDNVVAIDLVNIPGGCELNGIPAVFGGVHDFMD